MTRAILFDTIAAGGGHVATARAMRDAVERVSAGAVTGRVRDAMLELGFEVQDRRHKRLWASLLRAPRLVRAGQRALDLAPRAVRAVQGRTLDGLARRAAADLADRPVDLVVVNHGFLMMAYARARRRYGLRRPIVTFATEPFDANALWAEPETDRTIAPSHAARAHLARLGVPAERVDMLGYPVAGAILAPPSRQEARRRLGIDDGRWALLSLGGEGVGDRPDAWVDGLVRAGVRVMAIAGRNAALAGRLAAHPAAGRDLQVHGFVDDMPLRLAAVDVVVGKAGPASVMEALAAGRSFLATGYAGLNEAAVVGYLGRSGLGRLVRAPSELPAVLAEDAGRAHHVRRPDFRDMADRLGRHLVALAAGEAAPPPLGLDRDPWGELGDRA